MLTAFIFYRGGNWREGIGCWGIPRKWGCGGFCWAAWNCRFISPIVSGIDERSWLSIRLWFRPCLLGLPCETIGRWGICSSANYWWIKFCCWCTPIGRLRSPTRMAAIGTATCCWMVARPTDNPVWLKSWEAISFLSILMFLFLPRILGLNCYLLTLDWLTTVARFESATVPLR